MDTLISQLDHKYEQYKKNISEHFIDSDTLVFESAYDYFCITEKQPKIKEILEKDRQDLEKNKKEIVKKNKSSETQKEFLESAEFNSLSFCYDEVLKVVYLPMTKHKKSQNPLSEKDIVGDTQLLSERFLNTMNFLVVGFVKLCKIPIKKDVEARTALYKMAYNFKRPKYPLYMEQIHKLLVPQLLEIYTQKPEVSVVKNALPVICIDDKKGIYCELNPKAVYAISRISKRFNLIKYLQTKGYCKIDELAELKNQKDTDTMKAITEINRLFRKNTGLNIDLINHSDTSGYSLNKTELDIKMMQSF